MSRAKNEPFLDNNLIVSNTPRSSSEIRALRNRPSSGHHFHRQTARSISRTYKPSSLYDNFSLTAQDSRGEGVVPLVQSRRDIVQFP